MKKLILLSLIATVLFACNDKNDNNTPKPDLTTHKLSFRPAPGIPVPDTEHLSPLQIVKEAESMRYKYQSGKLGGVGFGLEDQDLSHYTRDTINVRLHMNSVLIIDQYYVLDTIFIEGRDLVFVRFDRANNKTRDTVAYIPNAVLSKAAMEIKQAYHAGNIDAIYRAYDSAYTFIPITGKEWRELKAQGKN